ncbi:Bug family tripartite tricarboxylate transporter substrate binding protein [Hydrogenophaga palleronii]|uniref:Bug family tripartite tricarboxylate transporter substrate binding protein n=1 Tax=Hydrogenophaga palleronii TaxID=65655 RepID=UPI000826A212|nr:tripartite tricarboxylate transporter substrate binding protein [Hydrogenophaga palleronii]
MKPTSTTAHAPGGLSRRTALAAMSMAGLSATGLARGQTASDYPNKPIRVVVTFPPGGSADAVFRLLVPRLGEKLGQPVIVDNRPGAGGNVGMSLVAKSPNDGYTLGLGAAGALSANVSLYEQMPFDVQRDLKPVAMLAGIPFVLVGHPSMEPRTLKALIERAKSAPDKLSIAHGGNGTAMHLSAALFQQMAGIKLVEVAYRGSGPATLDTLGGQVPLAIVDLPASLQHIQAGRLIAYAATGTQRLPSLPDVPTMAEAGVPGYDSTGWFGIVAPAGTPDAIVSRLNAEINAGLRDEQTRATMHTMGVAPAPGTPAQFASYIASETSKWATVIRTARIKLD